MNKVHPFGKKNPGICIPGINALDYLKIIEKGSFNDCF